MLPTLQHALDTPVYHACRIVQYFAATIEKHPLLIYYSAMPFSPSSNPFHKGDLPYPGYSVATGLHMYWPSLLQTIWGHKNYVTSVAFSQDGSKIVSGSHDKTVRVWDAGSGQELIPALQGHEGPISSVAVLQDGSRTISGSMAKVCKSACKGGNNAALSLDNSLSKYFLLLLLLRSLSINSYIQCYAVLSLDRKGQVVDTNTKTLLGIIPQEFQIHMPKFHGNVLATWHSDNNQLVLIRFTIM